MQKKSFFNSLIFKLLLGIIIGIFIGSISNESFIAIIDAIKRILGDLIGYIVPLIVLGFITPAIVSLKESAGKVLSTSLLICYISSVGAATFSFIAGRIIIPHLNIASQVGAGKEIPEAIFKLSIAPIMPVMTALISAVLIGLAVLGTGSTTWENLLKEFNNVVLWIVDKVVIRILPLYIGVTFAELSYQGTIISELPVFLKVILIVIVGHFIWMALLYSIAGAISKANPKEVYKYYGPAYVTALGTISCIKMCKQIKSSRSKDQRLCNTTMFKHSPLRISTNRSILRNDSISNNLRRTSSNISNDYIYPTTRNICNRSTRSSRRYSSSITWSNHISSWI